MENLLLVVAAGIRGGRGELDRIFAVENVKKAEFNLKKAKVELKLARAQLVIAEIKCNQKHI